jgi:type IV pilus assembly protein PilC
MGKTVKVKVKSVNSKLPAARQEENLPSPQTSKSGTANNEHSDAGDALMSAKTSLFTSSDSADAPIFIVQADKPNQPVASEPKTIMPSWTKFGFLAKNSAPAPDRPAKAAEAAVQPQMQVPPAWRNKFQEVLAKKSEIRAAAKSQRFFRLRLSMQDQIMFAKRLAVMVRAGVPILKALQMIRSQVRTKAAGHIFGKLAEGVERGQYLAAGMQNFKKIFGDFAINIVRVGEISGTLQDNLEYLAEELKKKQALRKKVISALIYPLFIIFATMGITLLLTLYVFPKVLPIFESFHTQLPFTTRALIAINNLFVKHYLILFGALAVLVTGWVLAGRRPKIKLWMHRQIFRLPILGKLLQSYHLANLSRTLGILLKSDVLIVQAFKITADCSPNLAYRQQMSALAAKVSKGEKISIHLEQNPKMFPAITSQMVSVGEQTGHLSDSLLFLAEMYEAEVDELTKNLSSLIEPALMIFMGLVVGFIALSIITPIYGITQNLHP